MLRHDTALPPALESIRSGQHGGLQNRICHRSNHRWDKLRHLERRSSLAFTAPAKAELLPTSFPIFTLDLVFVLFFKKKKQK